MEIRAAKGLLTRWRSSPELLAAEALGVNLWDRQVEVLRALTRPGARVAVRSGHKVGKTMLATVALYWWALTQWRGRAVFTGPTFANLANVLWPEIRGVYRRAKAPLGGKLFDDLGKGVKLAGDREIFGLTVKDPEAFAGISGNLLFVIDEASGVSEKVYDAIFGNSAGNARILLTGNPTRVSGTFFDAYHSKRAAWTTFKIDSREGPNFRPGPRTTGMATPEWVEWAKEQWGEGTPSWDVRVAGDFPRQGSDSVIALGLVEEATQRWEELQAVGAPTTGSLAFGVDVARFGDDDSVIAVRRGDTITRLVALHGQDTVQLTGRILELAHELRDPREPPPAVKVDVCGVGAGVVDQLGQHRDLVRVLPVDAGAAPTSQPAHGAGYSRLRDQLWFGVREWLRSGGSFAPDPKLEAELVSPCYAFDERGRYRVEAKDKTKEKLKRSPDRADAVALAIYDPPMVELPPPREGSGGRRALAGKTGGF